MMPYEYTIVGIQQHRERLHHEAENYRQIKLIRQRQTGHRMGTLLVKTGTLLILAGRRLQRQNTSLQLAVRTRRAVPAVTTERLPNRAGGTARGLSAEIRMDK